MSVTGSGADQVHPAAPAGRHDLLHGLSKTQRLLHAKSFREAFDQDHRYVGRLMVIWTRAGADAALRLGVVSSKKSFRRAVDRNKARRLIREAFRLNRKHLTGEVDFVIVARMPIIRFGRQDVEKELLYLAGKAGVRRNEATCCPEP